MCLFHLLSWFLYETQHWPVMGLCASVNLEIENLLIKNLRRIHRDTILLYGYSWEYRISLEQKVTT